ncbi:TetR family transcriptional regulator [Streptomyces qinglanensis]|uniref:TetR family transcriptional regulator n=1 Tax=Streptomyces qinglanensis TaxID=943816 RepID=A0A1E7K7I7_9ACTN|nr:TetR/AcrR family transcriptional regulator [Streptomyces qinglanensis]OEU99881.1 TetR family transcriptional regulator [Streptomyces qinglanensis]
MSPSPSSPSPSQDRSRNRRADARRSRASILDAAIRLLNERPDASVEAVATAAGVTRQTVYAHFPSRERLLAATLDRLTERTAAAMAAAEPDSGPAAEALLRLLDAAERCTAEHPGLVRAAAALPTDAREDAERHVAVAELLERVVRRGRHDGEFDDGLPADWLVSAVIALAHTASEQAEAGRLSPDRAREVLRTSLLRLLGTGSGRAAEGAGNGGTGGGEARDG